MLLYVILAMLIARAAVVFSLVPLVSRLPGAEVIDRKFQAVMYWGGLRGAIALAIALSLGDFRYADTFVVLVTGAVLFTLIVPGLSIEKLSSQPGPAPSATGGPDRPQRGAAQCQAQGAWPSCPNCSVRAASPRATAARLGTRYQACNRRRGTALRRTA